MYRYQGKIICRGIVYADYSLMTDMEEMKFFHVQSRLGGICHKADNEQGWELSFRLGIDAALVTDTLTGETWYYCSDRNWRTRDEIFAWMGKDLQASSRMAKSL